MHPISNVHCMNHKLSICLHIPGQYHLVMNTIIVNRSYMHAISNTPHPNSVTTASGKLV